ncbi:uncharacterized protein LOC134222805 [Armigeres subalbatus]|uniref:uncharacterized protein LOC134222805 n=1 Tax=Armigeres subalbatus TaxID=124917 RepID=UPI002ED57662
MFSDNGVGTKNKLKDLLNLINDTQHQAAVANYCTNEGIRWHFSPPRAPHFGGLWEAAVKSAKYHLLRVVGEDAMSPEDFQTLLAQVEACLNSRPITPLSDDPNDLEPLTLGHFLIGSSLQDLPEPDWKAIPTNRLDIFQMLQRKLHQFWERWRTEYLCQLQGRTKRLGPVAAVKIGKLVVICDKNLPPMRWKMRRFVEIHPGLDEIVRVVTLRTKDGLLKRPVEGVCLLPNLQNTDVTNQVEEQPAAANTL